MSESSDLGNCSASEPFALRVIGDDMLPEFKDGHIIIIDPGGRVTFGLLCYREVAGGNDFPPTHRGRGWLVVHVLSMPGLPMFRWKTASPTSSV